MASENVLELTDANFNDEVLKSTLPVLVDFWAPWCAPCRAIAPIVEELAAEYKGKVKFGKLDTDQNPVIASAHNIRSIPTLLVFHNQKVVEHVVGAVPKDKLVNAFKKYIANA